MEEVNQELKVGDKVRCINGQSINGYQMKPGYVGVITHVSRCGCIAIDNLLGVGNVTVCWPSAFELIKEEKQMKATDKVMVEVTLGELAEIYIGMGLAHSQTTYSLWSYACDLLDPTQKKADELCAGKSAEAILCFNSYGEELKALIFPEPVEQKSPQQIQIEQLQETIRLAGEQIKLLKEGV